MAYEINIQTYQNIRSEGVRKMEEAAKINPGKKREDALKICTKTRVPKRGVTDSQVPSRENVRPEK